MNGIAVQQRFFGLQLAPSTQSPAVDRKDLKRSVNPPPVMLPSYNPGERIGLPYLQYVEVSTEEVMSKAWKNNFLWMFARLHASVNQKMSGWTGFNISTRDEMTVHQDNIGYLPTINAPAANLSTVYEILSQSERIRETLSLKCIVLVFDQALYAKVMEVLWKRRGQFSQLIPRMGAFHTICTYFITVVGKRFQDASLKDLCIEPGVVAEGSISGIFNGRHYN